MTFKTACRCAIGWAGLCALFVLWQGWSGTTLYQAAGSWQYDRLGSFRPALTLMAMAAVLIVPALIALALFGRYAAERRVVRDPFAAAVRMAAQRLRLLLALAGLAVAAAVVTLLLMLLLPRTSEAPQRLDIATAPATTPAPGPAVLTGARPAGPEIRYVTSLLGIDHAVRFLPVAGTAGARSRIVVQLADDGLVFEPRSLPDQFSGLVVANALPPGVHEALLQRGELAAGPYWVLFTSAAESSRGYWTAAGLFLAMGLLLLLFAGLQWRQLRLLERNVAEPAVPEVASAA